MIRYNFKYMTKLVIMRYVYLFFMLIHFASHGQRLGFAVEQINGQALIQQGYSGQGIKIGVVDGGFLNANTSKSLAHLFQNNQIIGYRDYATPDMKPYGGSKFLDDGHGTEVLTLIGGYNSESKVQFGLATKATFYLARTDHGGYEKREEEKNAIKALVWMAEQGVRVVNMSLGYNYDYTDPKENYKPQQMDGESTILTRAVDSISKKYDMLIVVASGNDGDNSWKINNSPADATLALTVGATKLKMWDNMAYSSIGTPYVNFIKPEVACFSPDGTSFSAPVITGLAASLLSANPELTAQELKQLIISSCHLSCCPNNLVGYGVPNADDALNIISKKKTNDNNQAKYVSTRKKRYKFRIKTKPLYVTVFHKKENNHVVHKQLIHRFKKKIKIHRKEKAVKSTVLVGNKRIIEVSWKD